MREWEAAHGAARAKRSAAHRFWFAHSKASIGEVTRTLYVVDRSTTLESYPPISQDISFCVDEATLRWGLERDERQGTWPFWFPIARATLERHPDAVRVRIVEPSGHYHPAAGEVVLVRRKRRRPRPPREGLVTDTPEQLDAPRGSVRTIKGRHYARARYGLNRCVEKVVPWAKTREEALAVAGVIAELSRILAAGGRADLVQETAARVANEPKKANVEKIREAVAAIVKGATKAGAGRHISFEQWARRWTSGELSREHPDHVATKDWSDDISRLKKYIVPQIGPVPIHAITVAHGDLVMKKCPLENVASRRHVAQVLHRVMALAVYPGKLIAANPFPREWMPKLRLSKRRRFFCLWPREDLALMRCARVPLVARLFFGILAREGMREAELLDSTWEQWNLAEGAFTTRRTKTDDPRMWIARPDVVRVLRWWQEQRPRSKGPFSTLLGGPGAGKARGRKKAGRIVLKADATKLAALFRESLASAKVDRAELFTSTEHSGKIRVHDLRATFVTVSLAMEKPDTWIRDRTGHRTASMIDRYRREARQYAELKLGELAPLDKALGIQLPLFPPPSRRAAGKPAGTKSRSAQPRRKK